MFRFLHPTYLYLLIPLALLGLFAIYQISKSRRSLKEFGDTPLVKQLMPDLSLRRKLIKDFILILSAALILMAIARPQLGSQPQKVVKKGIEVMVCLDISNSMLADDVKPNRLNHTKLILSRVIDHLDNDKVGMILFAGDAFVQLPITSDFISAKMFLSNASPEMISRQGTAVGKALNLANRSFSNSDKSKKVILLFTDGENHEGGVEGAISEAKEREIQINVVGIGTPQGGPIRMDDSGQYLTDSNGNMVITRLNEEMCKELAQMSGGTYIYAGDISNTVRTITKSLDSVEKTEMETTVYNSYAEIYPYFLIPGIILVILDLLFLDRKNRYFRRFNLFDR